MLSDDDRGILKDMACFSRGACLGGLLCVLTYRDWIPGYGETGEVKRRIWIEYGPDPVTDRDFLDADYWPRDFPKNLEDACLIERCDRVGRVATYRLTALGEGR